MKQYWLLKQAIRLGGAAILLSGCNGYVPAITFTPGVPALTPSESVPSLPPPSETSATSTSTSLPVSVTETSTPPVAPATPTSLTETPPPTPPTPELRVRGSVVLEGGQCCIGGADGDTIQIPAAFEASSVDGAVNRMRVKSAYGGGCFTEADMQSVDWEPFAGSRIYPVTVGLNWIGFYVTAQFQDEQGNLSPVVCDDISVEGSPPTPLANATDWYGQIQCFTANQVYPGPGEMVNGPDVKFVWPNENNLPEGIYYKVFVYGAADNYAALVASEQTRETSIRLPIPPERAGDLVWYVTLVDENGNFIDHGQCSSFPASLLTVDPYNGIKGIHFDYRP